MIGEAFATFIEVLADLRIYEVFTKFKEFIQDHLRSP